LQPEVRKTVVPGALPVRCLFECLLQIRCCNLGVTHFGSNCYLPLTSEPCDIDVVARRAFHDVRPEFFHFLLARNLLYFYGFRFQFPGQSLDLHLHVLYGGLEIGIRHDLFYLWHSRLVSPCCIDPTLEAPLPRRKRGRALPGFPGRLSWSLPFLMDGYGCCKGTVVRLSQIAVCKVAGADDLVDLLDVFGDGAADLPDGRGRRFLVLQRAFQALKEPQLPSVEPEVESLQGPDSSVFVHFIIKRNVGMLTERLRSLLSIQQ
ncbi:unnamed protein product, partial [Darwinula stevensoni]